MQFEVKADSVALPIHLTATSVSGFTIGEIILNSTSWIVNLKIF